jgi:uncharacterized membrane protein HdeD (DUF308 family)
MNIAVIIAVAILIEGLVEYGKTIADTFNDGEKRTALIQVITIVIGVGLAFAFNADMFVSLGLTVNHYIGMMLTGIVMSRGSNYVSDLIGKIGQATVG